MTRERVQIYCFDWEEDKSFEAFLREKEINYTIYSILECISRQGIMKFHSYEFDHEPYNADLKLHGNNYDAYISAIQEHIEQVEKAKKESFNKTQILVDDLNMSSTNKRLGDENRGKHPLLLLQNKTIDGTWLKPKYFLRYGMEKLVFGKIISDIEGLIPTESDIETEINEEIAMGKWKNQVKGKYVNAIRAWFSKDGGAPGKYIEKVIIKFLQPGNPTAEVPLIPERDELFKIIVASYYSVFYPYLNRENFKHHAGFRSGSDGFLAEKLKYMCKKFSERISSDGFDLNFLFDRDLIKGRIGNNDFSDKFKKQMEDSGLINKLFIEHLSHRFK